MMAADRTDVVIVGAGAAGLSAALAAARSGASVRILEKAPAIGGTLSISGGIVWAPCNHHMKTAGISDSREEALAYFLDLDPGLRREPLEAFIDGAGPALAFLEEHSRLAFSLLENYPDYYLDRPGAKAEGGRALDSGLFAFSELGDWQHRIAHNGAPFPLTVAETPLGGGSGVIDPDVMADRVGRDVRGFGQALAAALLEACISNGVTIELDSPVTALLRDHDRVTGVEVTPAGGQPTRWHASRGVIVTTGGFEWNQTLVRDFLRGPISAPASPPGNTGDGLKLVMSVGAALGNMTQAWWCPTIAPDGETWDGPTWQGGAPRAYPILIERTMPGAFIVNSAGQRFCNEAGNYSAISGAFHQFDPASYSYPNLPAWLVFDEAYRARVPVASAMPGTPAPAWMVRGETAEELGAKAGIDGNALAATLARFNGFARQGADADFQRGVSAYDRFYGDRSRPGASATLGTLETPPYYAVPLHLGVLGTNGGARTDSVGRVLDTREQIIPGLYAAGNVMACPTGGIYAGAGGTLGPALTFGVLAGRHAARGGN